MKAHVFAVLLLSIFLCVTPVTAGVILDEEFNYEEDTQLVNTCWRTDDEPLSIPFTVHNGSLYVNDISQNTYQSAVYDSESQAYKGDFKEVRIMLKPNNEVEGSFEIMLSGKPDETILNMRTVSIILKINADAEENFSANSMLCKMMVKDEETGMQNYYNSQAIPVDFCSTQELRVILGSDNYCRVFLKDGAFWHLAYIAESYMGEDSLKEFNSLRISTKKSMLAQGNISRIKFFDVPEKMESKTFSVPDQYSTIADAVKSAHYGDIITLKEGTHEGAELTPGLSIKGDGITSSTITSELTLATDCKIENLSVNHAEITIPEKNKNATIKRVVSKNGTGYGIRACNETNFTVENCTIVSHGYADDSGILHGGGISYTAGCKPVIRNNIIAYNNGYGIKTNSYVNSSLCEYNNVYANNMDYSLTEPGEGSLSVDPLFKNAGMNDYRLLKRSPCIDSGSPDAAYNDPDGTRNDIGAFQYLDIIVTVSVNTIPVKVTEKKPYSVAWEIQGDISFVDQTEVLWGMQKSVYTNSGKALSGVPASFQDTLNAPDIDTGVTPANLYLVVHALVEGEDLYSVEKIIVIEPEYIVPDILTQDELEKLKKELEEQIKAKLDQLLKDLAAWGKGQSQSVLENLKVWLKNEVNTTLEMFRTTGTIDWNRIGSDLVVFATTQLSVVGKNFVTWAKGKLEQLKNDSISYILNKFNEVKYELHKRAVAKLAEEAKKLAEKAKEALLKAKQQAEEKIRQAKEKLAQEAKKAAEKIKNFFKKFKR